MRDYGSGRGIVLEVRSDRIALIEQNGRLKGLIRRTLGEGIYLLSKEDREEWEEALKETGIETIPRTEKPGRKIKPGIRYEGIDDASTPFPPLGISGESPEEGDYEENETLKAELEELKNFTNSLAALAEDEKEEILSRIDRGIILEKQQIRPGMIRRELTMVKGLDFQEN